MGRSKLSTGNWAPKIKTTLFSSSIFSFLRPCSPRLHERLRNAWRIPRTNWDRLRSRENKFILVGSYGGSDPSFRKTQDQTAGAPWRHRRRRQTERSRMKEVIVVTAATGRRGS